MMVIEGSGGIGNKSTVVGKYTSRPRTVVASTAASRLSSVEEDDEDHSSGFLGLVALVTSFPGGSPVYADALEAESSALSILAPDAGATGVESLDQSHCVLYSDGADNCIVNVQTRDVGQQSTAVSEIDPPATEQAPAIRCVDAI